MIRDRLWIVCCAVGLFLSQGQAHAATFAVTSLSDLVKNATLVARITIQDRYSYVAKDRIFTRLLANIDETLAGTAPKDPRIEIVTLGGNVEGIVQYVEGSTTQITNGTPAVMALTRQSDGAYHVIGMATGVFLINPIDETVVRMIDPVPASVARSIDTHPNTYDELKRAVQEATRAQ